MPPDPSSDDRSTLVWSRFWYAVAVSSVVHGVFWWWLYSANLFKGAILGKLLGLEFAIVTLALAWLFGMLRERPKT